MNPLTHAYFALELFKGQRLTSDQQDHLIVGSIIPDISQLGLVNIRRTHTQGFNFLSQAKNLSEYYFALGLISHGEKPAGLDYYSHKKRGYLDAKQKFLSQILHRHRTLVGRLHNGLAHNLAEFSIDYLVAQKDPSIIKKVHQAFLNPRLPLTTFKFFRSLNVSERKAHKINRCFNNHHLQAFFHNACSLAGTTDNWFSLRFFRHLKQEKHLPFRQKLKRLTQLSYYNLKRKLRRQSLVNLFQEASSYLEKDCFSFLSQTQKRLLKLKRELLLSSRQV